MAEQYYIQDGREYVGNSVLWWGKNRSGYVCDIRKAGIYSKEEAGQICLNRKTDIMWPKNYIDKHISYHVDAQYLDPKEVIVT